MGLGRRSLLAMASFLPIPALCNPVLTNPGPPSAHATLPYFHRVTASRAAMGISVVAFGSSSTQGTGASSPSHSWPSVMGETLEHAWPWSHIHVLNRGKLGDDSNMMMERFERDVMEEAPDLMIWQAGANDMIRGVSSNQFEANVSKGIEWVLATGSDVVLMGTQDSPRIRAAGGPGAMDSVLSRLATHYGIGLILRTRLQAAWKVAGISEADVVSPDNLHYTDMGYALLGRSVALSVMEAVQANPHSKMHLARLPQH